MSIIYDALQKTQRNREYLKLQNAFSQKPTERSYIKPLSTVLAILITSGCIGVLSSIYWPFSHSTSTRHSAAKPLTPSMQGQHLWMTDATKSAQTNEQMVKAQMPVMASAPQPVVSSSPAAQPTTTTLLANDVANALTLNGVMITGAERIVLINNQPFHLGDIVHGMKIVSIDINSVKLQEGQNIFELKVPV